MNMFNFLFLPVFFSIFALALWPQPQGYEQGSTIVKLQHDFAVTYDIPSVIIPTDLQEAVHRTRKAIKASKHKYLAPLGHGPLDGANVKWNEVLLKNLILTIPSTARPVRSIEEESVVALEERSEGYQLFLPDDGSPATINASTTLGLLRGLTTFEQLFFYARPTLITRKKDWHMTGLHEEISLERNTLHQLLTHLDSTVLNLANGNAVASSDQNSFHYVPFAPYHIKDDATFAWRGFMLDTSRHYFSIDSLRKVSMLGYAFELAFHANYELNARYWILCRLSRLVLKSSYLHY